MIKHLAGSMSVVNANIALILFLSLASIYIFPGNIFLLAAISLVVQIILYPSIYGRLIETLYGKPKTEVIPLFKMHAWNYYTVIIIVYVPAHVIINSLNLIGFDQKGMQVMVAAGHIGLLTILAILLIYVLPLIFLLRENVLAIPLGLKFLYTHVPSSVLLIVLTTIYTVTMQTSIKYALPALLHVNIKDNVTAFFAYGLIHNFVMFYMNFMVFTAAASFLMKEFHLKERFNHST